jgi:hypothetical protein
MDSTTALAAALAYAGAAIGVATGYWSKTQGFHYTSLLPNHLASREKKTNLSGGWCIGLEPTDTLRLVAAAAGLLWPAYLLVSLFYQATRKIEA